MLKESCPVKDTKTVDEVMRELVNKAEPEVKRDLSRILEDYRDIFPENFPYRSPPHGVIDHKINVVPGSIPPHKSPYRISNAKMEELRRQVETLLEQAWIRPS